MKVTKSQDYRCNKNFKGLQAQKLKGFFVVDKTQPAYRELKALTSKTGLDIFTPNIASKSIRKEYAEKSKSNYLLWGQDYLTFLPMTKIALFESGREHLNRIIRATADGIEKTFGYKPLKANPHIRGGNFFMVKNNGKPELLINEGKAIYSEEQLRFLYTAGKIHKIPSLDYHLDLFIRPLKDNVILVADENKTRRMLEGGLVKVRDYMNLNDISQEEKEKMKKVEEGLETAIGMMKITQEFSPYKPLDTTEQVISVLQKAGYTTVRVPSNYYKLEIRKSQDAVNKGIETLKNDLNTLSDFINSMDDVRKRVALSLLKRERMSAFKEIDKSSNEAVHSYLNNFTNAIVTEKDGELVYITNGSLLDSELGIDDEVAQKIGFSTKQAFIESISSYVKKENIHFISEKTTKDLFKYYGGIHCTGAEFV